MQIFRDSGDFRPPLRIDMQLPDIHPKFKEMEQLPWNEDTQKMKTRRLKRIGARLLRSECIVDLIVKSDEQIMFDKNSTKTHVVDSPVASNHDSILSNGSFKVKVNDDAYALDQTTANKKITTEKASTRQNRGVSKRKNLPIYSKPRFNVRISRTRRGIRNISNMSTSLLDL